MSPTLSTGCSRVHLQHPAAAVLPGPHHSADDLAQQLPRRKGPDLRCVPADRLPPRRGCPVPALVLSYPASSHRIFWLHCDNHPPLLATEVDTSRILLLSICSSLHGMIPLYYPPPLCRSRPPIAVPQHHRLSPAGCPGSLPDPTELHCCFRSPARLHQ